MPITLVQARAAKAVAKKQLARIPGVTGIGLTKIDDDYALKVNLQADPPPGVRVPNEIAGVPVRVEVVGVIRKRK